MNLLLLRRLISFSPADAATIHQMAHDAIHQVLLPLAGQVLSAGVKNLLDLVTTHEPVPATTGG